MAVPDPSSTLTQVVAQKGPEQQWILGAIYPPLHHGIETFCFPLNVRFLNCETCSDRP